MTSPHLILNPPVLAPPRGFSHTVVTATGTTVYLGGQTAHDRDGNIVGDDLMEQFERAAANVVAAVAAAGGSPEHIVSMQIFTTDAPAYRDSGGDLADVYQRHFGRHYPALSFFEVTGLFDPAAKVELVCTAVIPEPQSRDG
jgi:enamine deaminase RidA (YjgF/YER057c/UK114 family)